MTRAAGNKDLKTESIEAVRQLNRAAGRCKKYIRSSIDNSESLARAECLVRQVHWLVVSEFDRYQLHEQLGIKTLLSASERAVVSAATPRLLSDKLVNERQERAVKPTRYDFFDVPLNETTTLVPVPPPGLEQEANQTMADWLMGEKVEQVWSAIPAEYAYRLPPRAQSIFFGKKKDWPRKIQNELVKTYAVCTFVAEYIAQQTGLSKPRKARFKDKMPKDLPSYMKLEDIWKRFNLPAESKDRVKHLLQYRRTHGQLKAHESQGVASVTGDTIRKSRYAYPAAEVWAAVQSELSKRSP